MGLVDPHDRLWGLAGHLAELEDHEGVCRVLDRLDDGLDLGLGNAELGAYLGGEAGKVGPCLDIEAAQEAVEPPSGDRLAAEEEDRCYREDNSFHGDTSLQRMERMCG